MNEPGAIARHPHTTAVAVAVGIVVADQATKAIVLRLLAPSGKLELIGRALAIEYVENRGAAFGVLGSLGPLVTVLAALVLATLLVYYHRAVTKSPWLVWAVGLIDGGAIGNLSDRLWLGHVVDFVTVGPWPTFNLADAAITVGVALLAVHFLREEPTPAARGIGLGSGQRPGAEP
jgi:signal peptidase II